MSKAGGQARKFLFHSAENISALLFGLVGAAMLARVFGPENLGRLSLVQAASGIFVAFATLGLDYFIIRDFALNRKDGELKGSILFAQSLGWVLYLCSLAIFFYARGEFFDEIYLFSSVAVSTYFMRVLFFKLYLQAINDAYGLAVSAVVSRIVALLFLVVGTVLHFSYDLMVFYLPLQAIVQAAMMFYGYRRACPEPEKMHVSGKRVRSLMTEAMPVLFSSILYFGYSQADILVLSHFMSVKEVGIYSAAMRLVPQAVFLGHVTVLTFYGLLSDKFQADKASFFQYAVKVARIQFAIAFVMAAATALCAPLLITLLYGSKFEGSAGVLAIGVWVWLFALPACLFSRLLVLARLARYELIKVLIVAPLSLGLNIFLIPRFGFIAAACVAVGSSFLTDFFIYGLFKDTRFIFQVAITAVRTLLISPVVSLRESRELFQHKS
ncbi:oligosaccharide flippase family protein [Undibacterium sp. Ren11W]|uniref:oligosaccharide flippase family protein n=1 Tax=Undibacterium sp. Ren11W TaxID=3413045 RepID=UPI003BF3B689